MRLAVSAQERQARNALTAGLSCVNPTRKPVRDAARPSARLVFSSIKPRSTRSPLTLNVESEKGRRILASAMRGHGQAAFSISFPSFVHLSSALYPATATIRPYKSYLPHG
jgi:hypothetical protein